MRIFSVSYTRLEEILSSEELAHLEEYAHNSIWTFDGVQLVCITKTEFLDWYGQDDLGWSIRQKIEALPDGVLLALADLKGP